MTYRKQRCVFIVNDDPEDQATRRNRSTYVRISNFYDGEALLNHLSILTRREFPELIIVDYQMPVLDGIELITELKSLLSGAKTAIVLWSSIQATELKKSATASGTDAFYSKAFSQKS